MEDNTQVQEPVQQAQDQGNTEPEVTLDDVYREAGLDKISQTTEPQQIPSISPQVPVQSPQYVAPAAPSIPDPYDTEAFRAYMAQQQAGMTTLQQATIQVANYLSTIQQREAKAALEADIGKAVSTVNEVVKHPNPKVVEAMLDAKARENPQFKALWDNRSKNPTAWNNALKVVSREIAKDFEYKADPRLVDSQKALKAAQRQMATTAPEPDANQKWDGLNTEDFDRAWQQLTGG